MDPKGLVVLVEEARFSTTGFSDGFNFSEIWSQRENDVMLTGVKDPETIWWLWSSWPEKLRGNSNWQRWYLKNWNGKKIWVVFRIFRMVLSQKNYCFMKMLTFSSWNWRTYTILNFVFNFTENVKWDQISLSHCVKNSKKSSFHAKWYETKLHKIVHTYFFKLLIKSCICTSDNQNRSNSFNTYMLKL